MPTLIEIRDELLAAIEASASIGGEIDADLEAWFSRIEGMESDKLDSYAALIRDRELRAAALKEEAERMAKAAKVADNLAKRLRSRLMDYLILTGQRKIETTRYAVTLADNGGKIPIVIEHEDQIPEWARKLTWKPDTDAIRTKLEAGGQVPGCRMGERGKHVVIA